MRSRPSSSNTAWHVLCGSRLLHDWGFKYLAFHSVNVEFLVCNHSLAMSVSCNIISTTRWYRLVPPPPAEMRYAIETLHSCRSSVADDASIRLNKISLAHPSTAESMLDARHSHCSHSNNLEHRCPLPQPVKQSRLYSFLNVSRLSRLEANITSGWVMACAVMDMRESISP